MTKVISWAGVLSSTLPKLIIGPMSRATIGADRGEEIFIPGRPGSWFFEEEPGNKRFTFECHVLSDDFATADTDLLAVAAWYEKRGVLPLKTKVGSTKYYEARIDSQIDTEEWRGRASFELAWVVAPYALNDTPTIQTFTATGPSDSDSFNVSDEFPAYPEIEVTAVGGNVTGFILTMNGDQLDYLGPTFASGGKVTISSLSETVITGTSVDTMLTGAYNLGSVRMSGVAGVFPTLNNGINNWHIIWGGSATSLNVKVTWRRRFL